jgi:hypothetical protein
MREKATANAKANATLDLSGQLPIDWATAAERSLNGARGSLTEAISLVAHEAKDVTWEAVDEVIPGWRSQEEHDQFIERADRGEKWDEHVKRKHSTLLALDPRDDTGRSLELLDAWTIGEAAKSFRNWRRPSAEQELTLKQRLSEQRLSERQLPLNQKESVGRRPSIREERRRSVRRSVRDYSNWTSALRWGQENYQGGTARCMRFNGYFGRLRPGGTSWWRRWQWQRIARSAAFYLPATCTRNCRALTRGLRIHRA